MEKILQYSTETNGANFFLTLLDCYSQVHGTVDQEIQTQNSPLVFPIILFYRWL